MVYICAMTTDSVIIKKVVTDVKLTRWGMVFYNNFLAFCMFPIGSFVTGEYKSLFKNEGEEGPGAARRAYESYHMSALRLYFDFSITSGAM